MKTTKKKKAPLTPALLKFDLQFTIYEKGRNQKSEIKYQIPNLIRAEKYFWPVHFHRFLLNKCQGCITHSKGKDELQNELLKYIKSNVLTICLEFPHSLLHIEGHGTWCVGRRVEL